MPDLKVTVLSLGDNYVGKNIRFYLKIKIGSVMKEQSSYLEGKFKMWHDLLLFEALGY